MNKVIISLLSCISIYYFAGDRYDLPRGSKPKLKNLEKLSGGRKTITYTVISATRPVARLKPKNTPGN